ncbi:RrF2 family transcriptional regulator [Paraburkholderia sp. ZP32-5]|uniref:RrF2 family transcriptional regulator n=1 Tax=Paraburkholderia sp. ZP32-5 TaxID=2883245 RepID=UPI002278D7EC|nr:Rrf2 family transcriptional regulator [Paraburkholderia sp. ZP32-5]
MKSTKFVTACYIMSFVGAHQPRMLSTTTIAKWVDTHAARARQIVSLLVKANLLEATRGGNGGVKLARPPKDITLLDIYEAVGDSEMPFFSVENPFSEWADHCSVHDTLIQLHKDIELDARKKLRTVRLSQVFVPWDEESMKRSQAARRGARKKTATA